MIIKDLKMKPITERKAHIATKKSYELLEKEYRACESVVIMVEEEKERLKTNVLDLLKQNIIELCSLRRITNSDKYLKWLKKQTNKNVNTMTEAIVNTRTCAPNSIPMQIVRVLVKTRELA